MAEDKKRRKTISRKIAESLVVIVAACVGLLIGVGYFLGYKLAREVVGKKGEDTARIIASSIHHLISEEVEGLEICLSDPLLFERIKEQNMKYQGIDARERESTYRFMDEEWGRLPGEEATTKYLSHKENLYLKEIQRRDKGIAEIFVTDKFGGLVAASGKTSDFYQADEEWWQRSFDGGKGKVLIEYIEGDESAETPGIVFAIPIKDGSANVVGICKAVLEIKSFLSVFEDFRIGEGGHVALVDEQANILLHTEIVPMSQKYCEQKVFNKISKDKNPWVIVNSHHRPNQKELASSAKVMGPYLSQLDPGWFVFVDQPVDEVSAPLKALARQLFLVSILAVILVLVVGQLGSRYFSRPVLALHQIAKEFSKGNLDYKANIRTNDEVESLAEAFYKMAGHLKAMTISKDVLLKEILRRRKTEEDLSQANKNLLEQESLLKNLIYDLRMSHEKEKKAAEQLTVNEKALKNMLYDLRKAHTSLHQMQGQVIQSEKLASIGQLAAGVAHEVKNPLAIILLSVELLKRKFSSADEKVKQRLQMIEESAMRANKIVVDLLNFSRISGKTTESLDIVEVLDKSVGLIENRTNYGKIKIQKEYTHAKEIPLAGDGVMMGQVFLNLLGNAIDAIGQEGTIYIRTYSEKNISGGGRLIVEVEDTGGGMPSEVAAKIFEPFFTTKDPGKGTGMGLSTALMIIEKHGAKIRVESKEGEGTKFIITFPLDKGIQSQGA